MIRVFPRRTKWTPEDEKAYVGAPPEWPEDPFEQVMISVTFERDKKEAERILPLWVVGRCDVRIGGPAYGDKGGEFEPGMFIKPGVTITSRGCPRNCPWCFVWGREGHKMRELSIRRGHIIQDNNLLACSKKHVKAVFSMLQTVDLPVKFPGGLDHRLFNEEHAAMIKDINLGEAWFSCDTEETLPGIERCAKLLKGIDRRKRRCYVLCGFKGQTLEEAEKRVRRVYSLGMDPFAMFYVGKGGQKKTKDWACFCRTWTRAAAYRTLMKGS